MFYDITKFILCHELYTILIIIFQYFMKFIYINLMFYDITKFKNYILCHKLYIILIIIFQYFMKFIYKSYVLCHHEI